MKIRKELHWFADHMEAKLADNDHKGGWLNEYVEFFLTRMDEEYQELLNVLINGDAESAIAECADIANFAMMLADNLHRYGIISDGWLTVQAMKRITKSGGPSCLE